MSEAEEPCQDEDGIRADADAAFRLLDLDGDGEVSVVEMRNYLTQFSFSDSAVGKIYDALDMDACGIIHLEDLEDGLAEYCRCEKCEPAFVEQVHVEADIMFDLVDVDKNGEISTAELREHLLTHGYTAVAADAVFKSLDVDGNGSLDRLELEQGLLKYARLREAIIAVVKTLVKSKQWSPAQQKRPVA